MTVKARSSRQPLGDQDGMGLVEVIVAMTLLALIMMSLAPVLIASFRIAARNATIAFATQAVNERIERARAASDSCDDYADFLGDHGSETVFDARGVEIEVVAVETVPGAECPGIGVQMLRVEATSVVSGELLAEAETAIAVPRIR
jgi:prepilin-type N-terminal cleavage/methylation domain